MKYFINLLILILTLGVTNLYASYADGDVYVQNGTGFTYIVAPGQDSVCGTVESGTVPPGLTNNPSITGFHYKVDKGEADSKCLTTSTFINVTITRQGIPQTRYVHIKYSWPNVDIEAMESFHNPEAWLTSFKHRGNLYICIGLDQGYC